MTPTDLSLASATELVELFRRGQATPVEATRAALDRIHAYWGSLNAFRFVDDDGALAAARASEARWHKGEPAGPVDGVPSAVKDLLLTRGWSTLRGSRLISPEQSWEDDAPSVARLREGGAVLLGKTTTPEFGWKGVTDSPLTGITRNPWNPERTPGGSSGGAAVAAATGMGALHLGTDGGGSIRIPASFTGIYGLKPTSGIVPIWPPSFMGTLSHVGPMTRTVADAALMLTVIAAYDDRDWYAVPYNHEDFTSGLEEGVAGLRITFAPTLGDNAVDPEVADIAARAASVFEEELGAHVSDARPELDNAGEIFEAHWRAGLMNMLEVFDAEQLQELDPGLREAAEEGKAISLSEYLRAVHARRDLGTRLNRFFRDYDLLLLPTMRLSAFDVGLDRPFGDGWTDWTPFTYPFNLSRQPAASVPCGLTDDGLPVGLQIVGPLHADGRVLRASRAFETVRPFPLPPMAS